MTHSLEDYHSCLSFHFTEQMSTTSSLLLLDDERKAQLDLLNNIDQSGKNLNDGNVERSDDAFLVLFSSFQVQKSIDN